MKFETNYGKLKNGVRVLTIPIPQVESVTTLVLVKTGSRNETDKEAGISHVLEHMLFKGTKQYPTPMALAEEVDSMGAINNAFTSKEYTGYYITSDGKHLEKSVRILASMVKEPLILPTDLKREQGVIVEEINMGEDHPMERAGEEFENLIYGGSKLGRLIIGTKDTVRGTTSQALRKYLEEWYRGSNMLVVLAGKVENSEQRTMNSELKLQKHFGEIGKGELREFVEEGKYGEERDLHIKRATEQAHFVMGVPGISMNDPRRYALQVAEVVLGGPMSSRLFNEIREKRGLAYYVGAEMETYYDVGYLAVKAGVRLCKLGEALGVVREEILKLGETMTEQELVRGKEYLLGKMPLQLEGSMEVAQFFGKRALMMDEIRQPEEVRREIEKVSLVNVKEVLAELVKESEIRTCVVGPRMK